MNDMESGARALFERSVQELDEAAVKRLRLARRSTLASASESGLRWQPWAGAMAAASVLALGLAWWWPRGQVVSAVPVAATAAASTRADPGADEPVLAEADEDSDLYAWLAEAPVAAERPGHRL